MESQTTNGESKREYGTIVKEANSILLIKNF